MLLAVATGLQVGLVVSCQHIHPARRKQGNPPCLPLSLPSQPTAGLQRQEASPTPSVHASLVTLRVSLLLAWGKQSVPPKNDLLARKGLGQLNLGSGCQTAPGPPGFLKGKTKGC